MSRRVRPSSSRVFVLGAGFTRAFFPNAPLQVDEYQIDPLIQKYGHFDLALRALEFEKERAKKGKINIERLFTRLEGMPYDREDAHLQFASLRSDLQRVFRDRLRAATAGRPLPEALRNFARYCVNHNITCITFNYDDVLDKALWSVNEETPLADMFGTKYWHPDVGYGFFCPPSITCIGQNPLSHPNSSSMYLLKLHGSVNWRVKVGFTRPYAIDAIVHHERWKAAEDSEDPIQQAIESQLNDDPLMVPPVLAKSALQEPIIQKVWQKARIALRDAEEGVEFIGYSCPVTDLAASFLLGSTVPSNGSRVTVINKPEDLHGQQRLIETYTELFPDIKRTAFRFIDALAWASEFRNDSA
jgi:hypothetical protein